MKKINSIWYGTIILKWAMLFLLIIPLFIWALSKLLINVGVLSIVAYISIGIGVFIIITFTVVLCIELEQDRRINKYYLNNKCSKVILQNGFCECQNCGNLKVKCVEKSCPICGVHFKNNFERGFKMDIKKPSVDLSIVSQTLYIPLLVKAKETKRKDAILSDIKSVEIIREINLDTSRFDGGNITNHGILVRTTILDDIVNEYLQIQPEGTIVNLGAGLDTRIERVDNGKLTWYDIDLSEVIELRRKYFDESRRVKFISKSILDPSWVDDINIDKNKSVLIIAEGLLMYFSEEQIKAILDVIVNNFPNSQMCFDVVHKFFIGKGVTSNFKWGIEAAKDIEELNSKVKLIYQWSVGDYHKNRQGLFLGVLNKLQSTKKRSQILQVRINK